MELVSHRVKKSELDGGDHIYTWRTGFTYAHHGIYVGGNKVVHFTRKIGIDSAADFLDLSDSSSKQVPACANVPDCGFQKPKSQVLLSCLDCFTCGGSLYRFQYGVSRVAFMVKLRGGTCSLAEADAPKTVIHRAMYLLHNGFGKYDLFDNNCEDFALYCKTGLLNPDNTAPGKSGQVYSVVGATLAATCSSIVPNPMAVAAIGASLYSLSRFCNDIGVKKDAVKVEVEDMVKGLKERANVNKRCKRSIEQAETPGRKQQKR